VHWASRACQQESSDRSTGMQGVESAALGAGIAGQSTETAGAAVAGTGTAAAGHNLLSGLLDCPGVVAFFFSSPSSLRMDSKGWPYLAGAERTEKCETSADTEVVQPIPP
jgi:hypothetical protein